MNKPVTESRASQTAARPLRDLGGEGRRAGHRGFRRRSARGRRPRRGRASASTAAIVHLKGRGDFVSMFVLDLAPGAKTAPQKHLYEEVVYVLSGHGSTTVEPSDGRKHSFEWGPKSLFALPLNARYQHFNSSGRERARLASHQQSRADAQPVPQRSVRLRQRVRVSRAAGRRRVLQRRRRVHPGAARPQHVGDQLRPRPRRLRAARPGSSAAPAAPT